VLLRDPYLYLDMEEERETKEEKEKKILN